MTTPANIINHVVLVLDASSSMIGTSATQLVKVADNQIAYLAQRSKELDQETRVTVYQFGSEGSELTYRTKPWGYRPPAKIECLVYDKDVLRMPSISQIYHAWGNTPLIDATLTAINDLACTATLYGEHSFLIYVLTDGKENDSKNSSYTLRTTIDRLSEEWTLAAFVPDGNGVDYAATYGFPKDNIAIWNSTTAAGVEEAGEVIRTATENFMQARAYAHRTGTTFRGTRNLFSLNDVDIKQVSYQLDALAKRKYDLLDVVHDGRIDETVAKATGKPYKLGSAYYQLTKREEIQPQKAIAIRSKNGSVYVGAEARKLLGLPDQHVKVNPTHDPDYDIFVQSTSPNRKLIGGTKVLVMK